MSDVDWIERLLFLPLSILFDFFSSFNGFGSSLTLTEEVCTVSVFRPLRLALLGGMCEVGVGGEEEAKEDLQPTTSSLSLIRREPSTTNVSCTSSLSKQFVSSWTPASGCVASLCLRTMYSSSLLSSTLPEGDQITKSSSYPKLLFCPACMVDAIDRIYQMVSR